MPRSGGGKEAERALSVINTVLFPTLLGLIEFEVRKRKRRDLVNTGRLVRNGLSSPKFSNGMP